MNPYLSALLAVIVGFLLLGPLGSLLGVAVWYGVRATKK